MDGPTKLISVATCVLLTKSLHRQLRPRWRRTTPMLKATYKELQIANRTIAFSPPSSTNSRGTRQCHIQLIEVNYFSDNIFLKKSSDFCIRLRFSRVINYRPISVHWHCCNRTHDQQADAIIKTISLFMDCFKYISAAVCMQHVIQKE